MDASVSHEKIRLRNNLQQLFGLTTAFLTFARLIVPLRIALALALTPAVDKYIVKGLLKKEGSVEVDAIEVRVPYARPTKDLAVSKCDTREASSSETASRRPA